MSKVTVLNERVVGKQFEVARHPRVELPRVHTLLQKKPAASVDIATPLGEALALIAASATGAVLVVDGGVLRGIVSEHEVVQHLLAGRVGTARLDDLVVACACHAAPDATLEDCLQLIDVHQLRHLAVLDGGKPVGLFAREELLAAKLAYLERICKERELDQQVAFLRGTYSC